eukprot:gnl/TRDRNA2_/TRDRNA2_176271_c0_seq1.p1 gnl/TRDRNA2_/TRDRNA2_176271_c0~~gnl/TRDRNA2_/TRDRNA2_176271_c0_seq1.p1  ORF type:complete len:602 (-),score=27.46 gnl/TRDRNA2_/TRDRNA2_176271_c0_seq1:451-2256(-)
MTVLHVSRSTQTTESAAGRESSSPHPCVAPGTAADPTSISTRSWGITSSLDPSTWGVLASVDVTSFCERSVAGTPSSEQCKDIESSLAADPSKPLPECSPKHGMSFTSEDSTVTTSCPTSSLGLRSLDPTNSLGLRSLDPTNSLDPNTWAVLESADVRTFCQSLAARTSSENHVSQNKDVGFSGSTDSVGPSNVCSSRDNLKTQHSSKGDSSKCPAPQSLPHETKIKSLQASLAAVPGQCVELCQLCEDVQIKVAELNSILECVVVKGAFADHADASPSKSQQLSALRAGMENLKRLQTVLVYIQNTRWEGLETALEGTGAGLLRAENTDVTCTPAPSGAGGSTSQMTEGGSTSSPTTLRVTCKPPLKPLTAHDMGDPKDAELPGSPVRSGAGRGGRGGSCPSPPSTLGSHSPASPPKPIMPCRTAHTGTSFGGVPLIPSRPAHIVAGYGSGEMTGGGSPTSAKARGSDLSASRRKHSPERSVMDLTSDTFAPAVPSVSYVPPRPMPCSRSSVCIAGGTAVCPVRPRSSLPSSQLGRIPVNHMAAVPTTDRWALSRSVVRSRSPSTNRTRSLSPAPARSLSVHRRVWRQQWVLEREETYTA